MEVNRLAMRPHDYKEGGTITVSANRSFPRLVIRHWKLGQSRYHSARISESQASAYCTTSVEVSMRHNSLVVDGSDISIPFENIVGRRAVKQHEKDFSLQCLKRGYRTLGGKNCSEDRVLCREGRCSPVSNSIFKMVIV